MMPKRGWQPGGAAPAPAPAPYGAFGNQAQAIGAGAPGAGPGGAGAVVGRTARGGGSYDLARQSGGNVSNRVAATKAANDTTGTPGTESGPGILENWFNQRASGTDPGWEYGMGRATDSINNQFAARGGYNSSGATGALSDMYANATSQREGQLDSLAGAASGEHQGRLNSMFTEGLGLANGQSNTLGGYTKLGTDATTSAQRQQMDLLLAKAGVDQKTRQAELDAMFNVVKTGAEVYGAA